MRHLTLASRESSQGHMLSMLTHSLTMVGMEKLHREHLLLFQILLLCGRQILVMIRKIKTILKVILRILKGFGMIIRGG